MTTYNTGNPIGSADPRDLYDNAENIDAAVNGDGKNWLDRLGRERLTVKALEEATPDAIQARDQAQSAAEAATLARDGALAGAEIYPTEAAGRAAVVDGKTFNVQGSGDVAAYQYRRINAASSTLLATYPSIEKVANTTKRLAIANELPGFRMRTRAAANYSTGFSAPNGMAAGPGVDGIKVAPGAVGSGMFFNIEKLSARQLAMAGSNVRIRAVFETSGAIPIGNVSVQIRTLRVGDSTSNARAYLSRAVEQVGNLLFASVDYALDPTDTDFAIGVTLTLDTGLPTELQMRLVRQEIEPLAVSGDALGPVARVLGNLSEDVASGFMGLMAGFDQQYPVSDLSFNGYIRSQTGGFAALDSAAEGAVRGGILAAGTTGAGIVFYQTNLRNVPLLAGHAVRLVSQFETSSFATDKARFILESRIRKVGQNSVTRAVSGAEIRQVSEFLAEMQVDVIVEANDDKLGLQITFSSVDTLAEALHFKLIDQRMALLPGPGALRNAIKLATSDPLIRQGSSLYTGGAMRIDCEQSETILDMPRGAVLTPGVSIAQASASVHFASRSFALDDPGSESVSNFPFSLTYSAPSQVAGVGLPHRYVTAATVRRTSDGAILTPGVDYVISENTGRIYSPKVGDNNIACTISYTGLMHRCDVISGNLRSGTLVVTRGTNRAIDPEEYIPAAPTGYVVLWTAYVNPRGVDLLPTWRYHGGTDMLGREAYAAWLEWCRNCMPKTLSKLRRGLPVKVAAYGSSSLARGGGTRDAWGGSRDAQVAWERIPADTLAIKDPKYTTADPDFANYTPGGEYSKGGFAWGLIRGMREKWGADVTYHNWAIGGTSAGGISGGADPAWLANVIADAPDIVILGFANSVGNQAIYADNKYLIEQFRAADIEVIVMATPRLNSDTAPDEVPWRRMHDDLMRVAIDMRCAYVSTMVLDGPGREYLISPKLMSNANQYNHSGPLQSALTANLLWDMVP